MGKTLAHSLFGNQYQVPRATRQAVFHFLILFQRSIGLPDVHSGYGFAIGNMAAFDMNDPEAVVSPGKVTAHLLQVSGFSQCVSLSEIEHGFLCVHLSVSSHPIVSSSHLLRELIVDTQKLLKYQIKLIFIGNCLGHYYMPGIIQNWLQNKLKHFPGQIIILSVS